MHINISQSLKKKKTDYTKMHYKSISIIAPYNAFYGLINNCNHNLNAL